MTFVASVMEDVVPSGEVGSGVAGGGNRIDRITAALRNRIGPDRHDLWFDGKTKMQLAGDALIVEAPNAFAANWIRGKFAGDLREAAAEVLGHGIEVSVRVAPIGVPVPEPRPEDAGAPTPPRPVSQMVGGTPPSAVMNPKYTLEEFVVGPSNQMAYHAAQQVAQNAGTQFNPLFIHGNCGLGKTHLLQGICQRYAKLHPTHKWLYLTAEQFTNEFLEAIKLHKTDAFRRRIRCADLLVIDDVHFLGNKKATQEEFLHTFNQVDASGKQVVLASDCAPRQIHSLSEQLSSRFVSGMVLRVDAPDLPTRLEILRRRVLRNQWQVSESMLMHIAQSSMASVREMEGLLLQTMAGITLINSGAPEAQAVVSSIKDRTAMRGPVPAERIVARVAEHFSLAPGALLGSGREKTVSVARAIAMLLSRRHTGMSFPEIGRAVGGRNHSTVIGACQRVEALVSGNDVVCWNTPTGPRHQAIAEVLHELEGAIRRVR